MAIKITKKGSKEVVPFYKLELGTVFEIKQNDAYGDGYKYMKVRNNDVDCLYNAVNLTNGLFTLEEIDSDTEVEAVGVKMTIEDNNN